MANLHDVSWGNRETDNKSAEETRKNLEQFRALYLIVWVAINAIYGYAIIYITDSGQTIYVLILTILVTTNVLIKLIAAIMYFIYEQYTNCAIWMGRKGRTAIERNRKIKKEQNKEVKDKEVKDKEMKDKEMKDTKKEASEDSDTSKLDEEE
mmetsp:Transcript_18218/g.20395  ORF Transcript_18218/g.20395 Transcript_18218/m.20395 type:complete len:152 (+) Transcript_18218:1240-1695(+)